MSAWLDALAKRAATRWPNGLIEGEEIVFFSDGRIVLARAYWCACAIVYFTDAAGVEVLKHAALASEEGITWARGWNTRAAAALRVTVALS